MAITEKIVRSPAWELIPEDYKSALVGLLKTAVGALCVILATWLIEEEVDLKIGLAPIATFIGNLGWKFIKENEYIK